MSESHKRKREDKPYLMSIRDKIESHRIEREETLAARLAQDVESEAARAEVEADEDDDVDQYNDEDNWEHEMVNALLRLA